MIFSKDCRVSRRFITVERNLPTIRIVNQPFGDRRKLVTDASGRLDTSGCHGMVLRHRTVRASPSLTGWSTIPGHPEGCQGKMRHDATIPPFATARRIMGPGSPGARMILMKPSVYVETSITSYLTAWPSRDLVRAAHQQVTRAWWHRRSGFRMFVSRLVIEECSAGDPPAATERLRAREGIPILEQLPAAIGLSQALMRSASLPSRAIDDALHVSIATVHGVDYFLTWSCNHINNAVFRPGIEQICRDLNYRPPWIGTSLGLSGGEDIDL